MFWVFLITIALVIILGCVFANSDDRSECALGICGIVVGVISGICLILYIILSIGMLQ